MRPLSTDEAKKVELEILKDFAHFCDENNLTYFLAYGTLIGAIRHKGFIPWDDDIDLWMPRDDYNRLIEIFGERCKNKNLKLIDPHTAIARHSFIKVIDTRTLKIEQGVDYSNGNLGVDVDVFPIDGIPEDEAEYKSWFDKLQNYYVTFALNIGRPKTLKGIAKSIIYRVLFGSNKRVLKKADKLHSLYPYEQSAFVGAVESAYNSINNRYDKMWYASSVEVEFENHMFKAPIGYDQILTKMYGDYMQLPPKDKQITHHTNKTYWKEEEQK